MSFLVDPPLLVGSGALIEAAFPEEAKRPARIALVAGFVGFSLGLYLENPATAWMWRMVGARSGRDWMLNSGITNFRYADNSPATHMLAGAIFATYPLWAHVGRRLGARLRGR